MVTHADWGLVTTPGTVIPPVGNHSWIPTPTIGRGGTKDGNYNFYCQACGEKVTKRQLIADRVPERCVPRER